MKIPSDSERKKEVDQFLEESKGKFRGVLLIGVTDGRVATNIIQMTRADYEQALNAAINQMHKILAEAFEGEGYVH